MKTKGRKARQAPLSIGWREWVTLPELCGYRIKAKVDTGARTSAIHAWNIRPENRDGVTWVRFDLHPNQRDNRLVVTCNCPVFDRRVITNSGGVRQRRYIVKTILRMGNREWPIQLSLANRDTMGFRMLIGRAALRQKTLIDPAASFLAGAQALR